MINSQATSSVSVTVNGKRVTIESPPLETTLLDLLRDQGLTGAKEGCAEGECGACMVAMVAANRGTSVYRPVNSCLVLLAQVDGQELLTVEGLRENGDLSDAQKKLAEAGGSQCGYCTPGFAVSLFTEQYRKGRTGPCDPHSMVGNLCRCTGYRPIRDAALAVGPAPDGPHLRRLAQPAPELLPLELDLQGQRFYRPASLAACLEIASRNPDAQWIAGGTDLVVESNLKFKRWPCLISLEAVPELLEVSETTERVRIGAALPLAEIAAKWPDAPAAFAEWSWLFASPSIRNRATLGGSLCTASPIGDSAPLLMALDASIEIAGPAGHRRMPLPSFFPAYRQTALAKGELVVAIEIPKRLPEFVRFYKVSKRRLDDISTIAAGFSLDFDSLGRVQSAVLAFGGVAATPVRAFEAERAITGEPWRETTVEKAVRVLDATLTPRSDHRGSAEYRAEVAKSLLRKFWGEAWA